MPVIVPINSFQKLYSEPKIFIPTKKVKDKVVPCIDKGCTWYVYFYYRNPETNKLQRFRVKKGINLIVPVTNRIKAIKLLRKAVAKHLQMGYSPFEVKTNQFATEMNKNYTFKEAIILAYDTAVPTWKEATINVNKIYLNAFLKWLKLNQIDDIDINEVQKNHISFYLDYLLQQKKQSITSRNNHKRFLSGLFTQLAIKDVIKANFLQYIPTLKTKPTKNKPFSTELLTKIVDYTKTNDPYLYLFLKTMWFGLLRPIEVTRIKIENINLDQRILTLETKTNNAEFIRIVEPLAKIFESFDINTIPKKYHFFTKLEKPGLWETKVEKSREDFFTRKFKKVKNHFKIDSDYGLYSFRHNAALSQYHFYIAKGFNQYEATSKVQENMRHQDLNTTKKYLRDIGAYINKDYSDDFNFEF